MRKRELKNYRRGVETEALRLREEKEGVEEYRRSHSVRGCHGPTSREHSRELNRCGSVVEGINTKADRIGTLQPTINKIWERLCGWPFHGDGRATWIPGHASLPGNERADKLAKEGAELPRAREESWMTLARARRWRKESVPDLRPVEAIKKAQPPRETTRNPEAMERQAV